MKIINRTVWILSLISLLADVASEMLYPVIPIYLKEIGFSVVLIGLLEGIAEFTAGLSKGYFGRQSDVKGVRLPYIKKGYFLSALSKPMMAMFTFPWWVFLARTTDRLGKGLRTAARDALLSQNATPQTKARVFAFHRGMDTLGAVIGPILALAFLHFNPKAYSALFYYAFIPGLLAVGLIFLLREKKAQVTAVQKDHFFSFFRYWKIASPAYKQLVAGLLAFTLFNSADVFLLLKTKEVTGDDTLTILAYVFYNLVYAAASYPLGILADRFGMKQVFCAGLLLFAFVYLLFAFSASAFLLFIAFFIYGLYGAATEGIAKAWITNLAHNKNTATAVGFYTSCQSIGSLIASILAGVLWTSFSSTIPFMLTSIAAVGIFIYFQLIPIRSS